MTIRELREKRANIVHTLRELTNKADAEKRALSAEEEGQWQKGMDEVEALKLDIDRREKLEAEEADLEKRQREIVRSPSPGDGDEKRGKGSDEERKAKADLEMRAFRKFLAHDRSMTPEEHRALNAATDAAGAYTLAPEQFVDSVLKGIDDQSYLRQWGTGYRVTNKNGLGVPTLAADPADDTWTTELLTGSADSTMAFGKRSLAPLPMAKRLLVSKTLLRSSGVMIDSFIRDRLAYKSGITWEKAMLTGGGSTDPLGVFTASASGISTGRDVSTGNTTTAFTFDGLINAKYALKGQYHRNAKWLFHRTAQRELAKLKYTGGDENYIWRESARAGEPDTLLGIPIFMSEYAPNTFTTGLYVGILGDFSFVWYVDMLDFQVQHLQELYAETNQDGFIVRAEGDAMPVLEEAFVRVKLA